MLVYCKVATWSGKCKKNVKSHVKTVVFKKNQISQFKFTEFLIFKSLQ